jgi:1-deoxy-D-xylulose 5-phosphate reductoisomerase
MFPRPHIRRLLHSNDANLKNINTSDSGLYSTGTTGYIGGDSLYLISQTHPDWELTALVRNNEKATQLTSKFPQVRVAYGDLDNAQVLEEESAKADIIYRMPVRE